MFDGQAFPGSRSTITTPDLSLKVAAKALLAQLAREELNSRNLEIINRHADRLNAEASDVLAYQVEM